MFEITITDRDAAPDTENTEQSAVKGFILVTFADSPDDSRSVVNVYANGTRDCVLEQCIVEALRRRESRERSEQ
jgi:hypothetical protein